MPAASPCRLLSEPASALLPDLIEELLAGSNRVRLGVGGISMAPRLRDHDCVVIEPLRGEHARFGDLLLYRSTGGALVLHRLVRRWRDNGGQLRLQTRGDANIRLDDSIDSARVLGRVRRIERTHMGSVDLDTVGERLRAVIVGAGKLLCSALYYKLAEATSKNNGGTPRWPKPSGSIPIRPFPLQRPHSASDSMTGASRELLSARSLPIHG